MKEMIKKYNATDKTGIIRQSLSPHRTARSVKARTLVLIALTVLFAATSPTSFYSCSNKPKRLKHVKKLEKVYGFILGERKEKLFKRAEGLVLISKVKKQKVSADPRSDMWYCSGPLDNTMGIDHVRLTFFDDYLIEVIVYFENTSVTKMRALKRQLEDEYGVKGIAPDGTVETAYKTYRFNTSDISITLRRITKLDGTELYIQFLHGGLHHRFLEWQKTR